MDVIDSLLGMIIVFDDSPLTGICFSQMIITIKMMISKLTGWFFEFSSCFRHTSDDSPWALRAQLIELTGHQMPPSLARGDRGDWWMAGEMYRRLGGIIPILYIYIYTQYIYIYSMYIYIYYVYIYIYSTYTYNIIYIYI